MIQRLLLIFVLSISSFLYSYAQAVPQSINYQGIVRDAKGLPLADKVVLIRIGIFSNEVETYFELREVKTNSLGIYSIQIGSDGAKLSSSTSGKPFNAIHWVAGKMSFRLSVSTDGGSIFSQSNAILFNSVPYALYSEKAQDIENKVFSLTNPIASDASIPTAKAVVDYVDAITGVSTDKIIFSDGTVPMQADLNLNNHKITNLANPIAGTDAVNKQSMEVYVGEAAAQSIVKKLTGGDDAALEQALKDFMNKSGEDITQTDQLNNFIIFNNGTSVKGATLTPVEIGFDKNSFNKATAQEVVNKPYNHDNNPETPLVNPLAEAINSLNPWKNAENTTAAKVAFLTPRTNLAGQTTTIGLQVNPDLTVQIGNFKNANIIDIDTQSDVNASANAYQVTTDAQGNLAVTQGNIAPINLASANTNLTAKDYMVYAKANATINLPSTNAQGRVNGRVYVIMAVGGDVNIPTGYKSIANFDGANLTTLKKGEAVKIIYSKTENAWLEIK